jgi:hypothetical protein
MNNQEMLEEIGRGLALLALQTAAENLAGLYSKNRLAEDLILPVFRLIFAAPDLRNANADQINSAHVDLVSDQRRLAVQVTTERVSAKVTGTLTGFLEDQLDRKYQRLIFFLLTSNLPNFQRPTRDGWDELCEGRLAFDSSRDIIGPLNLLPLIQALPQAQLEEAYKVIAKSVIGKDFIDVEVQLENVSRRALAYEMNSGKYIPNVFIETRDTKQLARLFCHPVLFLKRQLEEFPKDGLEGWNEFLTKIGQEPLPLPDMASLKNDGTLDAAVLISENVPGLFSELRARISHYGEGGRREIPIESIPAAARPYYEENSWNLTNSLGYGFQYRINDFVEGATAPGKRFFLLTGPAGQGKTNFVCDLIDTFLLRHGVPAALISVRKLALQQGNSLGARLAELLFDGKIKSFPECAALLSEASKRTEKPFVLILDGLNEHPQGPTFSREIELLLHDLLPYPHLKVLMTCRSEFFQQRFGNLESEALRPYLFKHHTIGNHFESEERSDLIDAYFDFFQLRRTLVSESVVERLQKDVLLLRFFCEAYGARGKELGYVQPQVRGIYRDEIFELYLSHKLDAIEDAVAIEGSSGRAQAEPVKLIRKVLEICLKHMLDEWQFSNIPVSVVPENLSIALERLLEEELIIRRDAPSAGGFFTPKDETLNFTFDEFRDFLLAQYLVQNVFIADREAFVRYLAKTTPPEAPPLEGLKKFLFYISRKTRQERFLEFYAQHQWYADVFHTEIFNIAPNLLTADDEVAVRKRLLQGGWEGQQIAIQLAVNWHREVCPRLNLDLLLSVLADCDDQQFQQIAVASFSERFQRHSGASVDAFAEFVVSKVLPDCEFDPNGPEDALFQFLAFLLPVDAAPMLESPAYRAMRTALDANLDYIEDVLLLSLGAVFTAHRPFLWRLLSAAERKTHRPLALEAALAQDRNAMSSAERTELDRFLQATEKWTAGVN